MQSFKMTTNNKAPADRVADVLETDSISMIEEDYEGVIHVPPFNNESDDYQFPLSSTSSLVNSVPLFDGLEDMTISDNTSTTSTRTTSEWDIITDREAPEIRSVMSFDSLHFTYKDALTMTQPPVIPELPERRAAIQTRAKNKKKQAPHQQKKHDVAGSKPSLGQEGEECDDISSMMNEEYDSFFMLDGCKGGRGGKTLRMFRKDGRTPKHQGHPYKAMCDRDDRRRSRRSLKESLRKL